MIRLALAVAFAVQPIVPSPPLDLPTLFPPAVPEGFAPLPEQPGRIGALDTPSAAGVLDRSGAMPAQALVDAGFRKGHSKAWSRLDTQEVLLDVLLEFTTDDQGEDFAGRIVSSRKDVTRFEVTGVTDAVGFERGPATPTYTTPGQREVVLRRGRVVAIVVVAGHATFPSVELATAVAQAQRAALEAVPLQAATAGDEDRPPLGLLLAAQALFVLAAWQAVMALQRTPLPFTTRPAPPATPVGGPGSGAPPSEAPAATPPRRQRP